MSQVEQQVPGEPTADKPRLPSRYHLITPTDWFRVPLRAADKRERAVRALVDSTYPNRDEHASQRRELRDLLTAMTEQAAARDGIELYLATQGVLGVPIPGTLLVTTEPEDAERPVRLPVGMVAEGLRDKYGERARVSVVELAVGAAVRCRREEVSDDAKELGQPSDRPSTVLDVYVPVPESGAWLLLTFSTPLPELADVQVEMFDAIAASLRWSYQ